MTAEVIVINKSAVAIAADSAVTIDSGRAEKIYNSVDKIFELSAHHPVGLMINGGLEFMGFPLGVLVKLYRSKRGTHHKATVSEYVDDFLSYLSSEVDIPDAERKLNVGRILFSLYNDVWDEINAAGRRLFAKEPRFSRPKFNNRVMLPILEQRIADLQHEKQLINVPKNKEGTLWQVYKTEHESALNAVIGNWKLIGRARSGFNRLCGLALTRAAFSTFSSVLIFAGFGNDEVFPSVQSVEIDGIVCDKMKVSKSAVTEAGKVPSGAEVLPFAQHEMVDRFLDGVDPGYDRYIRTSMRRVIQDFGDDLIDQHFVGSDADKRSAKAKMRVRRTALVNEFFRNSKAFKDQRFKSGILDMVRFMPKQELAHMAESLVNLTTIKRHVSAEKETVGGPIDIAVISKSEGFVWIKRKHYFDKEFNHRYFARHFGTR